MSSKRLNNRLKLNPKFEAAHNKSKDNDPWGDLESELNSATNGDEKISYEIAQARKNGKLNLSGISMTTLPDAMFDIRNELLIKYTGNIDEQNELKNHEKAWQCYGEEMLTVVDISENDLSNTKSLERFSCFKALLSLHLRNCQLESLPWDILQSNLKSLRVLNAVGNNFVKVPMNLLPESITDLNVADNCIESLGDDIRLPNLIKLNLHNNKKLVRLPLKLSTPSLQHAYFSKNSIEIIPKEFLMSCKGSLQTLELSENQLTLPMNLIEHSELRILELRYNNIRDIPQIHENLVKLDLAHNNISSIEGLYPFLKQCNEFGRTQDGDWFRPKLKEVHLGQNNLSELHSQTMAVMTKLSYMGVADNSLETIPSVVGYLPDLNKVVVDGNPFRVIRSAISYRPQGGIDTAKLMSSLRKRDYPPKGPGYHADAGYSQSEDSENSVATQKVLEAKILVREATQGKQTLNIHGRGLSGDLKWPELLDALLLDVNGSAVGNGVSRFNISSGKITRFGEEWVNALPSLSELDAQRNRLESLPSNLSQWHLKTMYCQRNCLSSHILDDVICIKDSPLCSNLVEMNLSMNKLQWIPDSIFDLNTLRILNLSQNQIKSLSWEQDEHTGKESGWRHGLISLEYLDLSQNKLNNLGYLPLALFGCKQLHTLLLNNNCLYDIPLELGLLEQLTKIDLLGNSQRKIGMRVLTQSTSKILKYLRERMDMDQISKARISHNEIIEALKQEYNIEIKGAVLQEKKSFDNEIGKNNSNSLKSPLPKQNVSSTDTASKNVVPAEGPNCSNTEGLEIVNKLKEEIAETENQLKQMSLSQAKRFALKKTLAMHRSKLIREERKLKGN